LYFTKEDGYGSSSLEMNWKLPDLFAKHIHSGAGVALGYANRENGSSGSSRSGTVKLAGQVNNLEYSIGGSWPDKGTRGSYSMLLGSTWKAGYKPAEQDYSKVLHTVSVQHNIPVGSNHKAIQLDMSASIDNHGKGIAGGASALLTGFTNPLTGDYAARYRVEYHQPITAIRKALWKLPVYVKGLDGSISLDAGRAWAEDNVKDGASISSGVLLKGSMLDIQSSFSLVFRASYRFNREKGFRFELPFGVSF
jgi:hypothetical protein